jgi:glutamyl aminopeptidase
MQSKNWPSLLRRLPSYIKPTHYDIELFPDPVADISYGSETITVDVQKRTRNIVLHAIADLTTINSDTIVVEQEGSSPVVTNSFYYDENREQFFVIQLEQELEIKEAHIYLEWQGPLVSTLVGINKVNYKDRIINKKKMGTINFWLFSIAQVLCPAGSV